MNDFWRRLLELERRQLATARGQDESYGQIVKLKQDSSDLSKAVFGDPEDEDGTAPTDPGWPCGLFAFYGILEYGYLDSTIGIVNSSVTDKPSIENIQDFRISQFTDSTGTLRQFRGASGWYFQAAASTSLVRVNNTVNDERDISSRSSWLKLID